MTLDRVNSKSDFTEFLSQGAKFPREIAAVLERLFGQAVSKKAFENIPTAIRGFETLRRSGCSDLQSLRRISYYWHRERRRPVWSSERSIGIGRDGSIELHHGNDFVKEDFSPQNILNDCLENEIKLLQQLDAGPNPRITFDAHGEKSYRGALHGAIFADDTDEGPPVQSIRALEPDGDKRRVIASAKSMLQGLAEKQSLPAEEVERASKQIEVYRLPLISLKSISHNLEGTSLKKTNNLHHHSDAHFA